MPTVTLFAVPENSPRIPEAEQTGWMVSTIAGPLDAAAQALAWRSLSRSPGQAVWIDWPGLGPPDLASLRRFRVACSETRIIVEVPGDLTPPDDTLAQVVGLGIWDIVRSPRISLAQVLTHPASFAAAALWQGGVRTFDEPELIKETVVKEIVTVNHETIVEKRVPMTNRSVLIAIWGAVPGTGASTLSVSIGRLLTQYGPTAVLDHAPTARRGKWVADGPTGLDTLQAGSRLPPELAIRSTTWELNATRDGHHVRVPNWRTTLQERAFSYVVVDAGQPMQDAETTELMNQADLNLLLLPAVSRMQGCWAWVDAQVQRDRRIATSILGTSQANAIRRIHPQAKVLGLPWPREAGHDSMVEQWLSVVLPDPAKPSWWGFRRNRNFQSGRVASIFRALSVGGLGLTGIGLLLWWVGACVFPHPLPIHGVPDWLHQASQWESRVGEAWFAKGRAALTFLHGSIK